MAEYIINVSEIENLQTIKDILGLQQIFSKAHSIIIQGGAVVLTRKSADGSDKRFDEITAGDDLQTYKETVLKYL